MEKDINIIYEKLNQFIKKYYLNELIKGIIIFVSYFSVSLLVFSFSEYFLYLNAKFKISLFSVFALSFFFFFWKYIIKPVFGLFKIGKHISYEEASKIIGKNFTNVNDKLINLLQLNAVSKEDKSLIYYSIQQKAKELEFVPFQDAVDYKSNIPYLKKATPFLVIFLLAILISPIIFIDGSKRFFDLQTSYVAPAPFNFFLQNEDLTIYEFSDIEIITKIDGEYIPDKAFINYNGIRVRMDKSKGNIFAFRFKNLNKSIVFFFDADGYQSQDFKIEVKNKPSFSTFSLELIYPSHTKKKADKFTNIKNLTIPEGTFINSTIEIKNTENYFIKINDSLQSKNITKNLAKDNYQINENQNVIYYLKNDNNQFIDSLVLNFKVLTDNYPEIDVKAVVDSVDFNQYYFNGKISDDYGFSALYFVVNSFTDEGTKNILKEKFSIPNNVNFHDFFHSFNLSKLNLEAGTHLSFYFEVFDNDKINNYKSAKSEIFNYNLPSKEEIDEKLASTNDDINKALADIRKQSKELNEEFKKINNDLKLKTSDSWEEKEKIRKLIDKHQNLNKEFNQLKKQLDQNMKMSNEMNEKSQELLDKQSQLNNLLDQVFDEETKKKFEELEKLLDKISKEQLSDKLKDMELSTEDMEKQLDQNIEYFKQMLVEEKMEKVLEKSKELAEKQKDLNQKQDNKEISKKDALEKQKEINKDFDKLKQEMDNLKDLNEDLANKFDLPDKSDELKDIEKDLDSAEKDLENDKGNDDDKPSDKSKDSQKDAQEKMEEFAESLSNDLNAMMQESFAEDLDDMRQILQNILSLSFTQEETMKAFSNFDRNDPLYVKYSQSQKNIIDDFKVIEDSITALSKRIPILETPIKKEINAVKYNHSKSLNFLGERQTNYAQNSQQYALTAINNLALLFNEIVEQMQKQQQQQMSGSGSCSKPGANSKPKKGDSKEEMKKMQQKLSEQIEKMKEQMKKDGGNKPDGKEGSKSGGDKSMSKSLAKMAAEQEYIRKQMQGLSDELSKSDKEVSQEMKKMQEDLEEIQKDLYNKNITQETLMRQQDILTRLLEAEKSVRERELDEQRKATENLTDYKRNIDDFKDYFKQKDKDIELLNKVPFTLSPFYKQVSGSYFKNLD